jgi:hypothetical protein
MGGGGGGDNGMMMMMMAIQQQQQMEQQRREAERQAFEAAQRGENQNYQRYSDLVTNQTKKVADEWDLYNANIGKIKKINPNYNAHSEFTFNPYTINPQYHKSTNKSEADQNQDLLNQWYSALDKQAFDDFNMAKSQYDASKNWLADVEAQQNALTTKLPGQLPGVWGASTGGGNVSGEAGADAKTQSQNDNGFNIGADGNLLGNLGSMPLSQTSPQTGFIQGDTQAKNDLASVFSNATGGSKTGSSGGTIF